MRKRSERLLFAAMALLVLGVATLMVLTSLAEQKRNAAHARIQKHPAAQLYERLTAKPQSTAEDSTQIPAEPALAKARDTIGAFNSLFEDYDEQLEYNSQWHDLSEFAYDPSSRWTKEQWDDLDNFLRQHEDLIDKIKLLAKRGGPVAALDLSEGYNLPMPHLAKMRNLARFLVADAKAKVRQGNVDEAVDNLIAGMQLGDALSSEPVLISQLVRFACYRETHASFHDAFPPGTLSEAQTRRLREQMSSAYDRQAFADSLMYEAMVGRSPFDMVREGDTEALIGINLIDDSGDLGERIMWRLYGSALMRPVLAADETTYLDTMHQLSESARSPFYETREEIEELVEQIRPRSWLRPVSAQETSRLAMASTAQSRHEANLDLTQMGLLLEQHYAQTGVYPESLDAIAPQLGGKVPVDPFTGEAYRYKPSGNTFQLYSVGRNLIDDNGEMSHSSNEGDYTWRGRKPEWKQKAAPKPKNLKVAAKAP